jgi:hypothetical protein
VAQGHVQGAREGAGEACSAWQSAWRQRAAEGPRDCGRAPGWA